MITMKINLTEAEKWWEINGSPSQRFSTGLVYSHLREQQPLVPWLFTSHQLGINFRTHHASSVILRRKAETICSSTATSQGQFGPIEPNCIQKLIWVLQSLGGSTDFKRLILLDLVRRTIACTANNSDLLTRFWESSTQQLEGWAYNSFILIVSLFSFYNNNNKRKQLQTDFPDLLEEFCRNKLFFKL